MWNPFLKVEWLKEGRNIRLPMMLIFYNAILAFITILFMFLRYGCIVFSHISIIGL